MRVRSSLQLQSPGVGVTDQEHETVLSVDQAAFEP
jgi:hypothetical protein